MCQTSRPRAPPTHTESQRPYNPGCGATYHTESELPYNPGCDSTYRPVRPGQAGYQPPYTVPPRVEHYLGQTPASSTAPAYPEDPYPVGPYPTGPDPPRDREVDVPGYPHGDDVSQQDPAGGGEAGTGVRWPPQIEAYVYRPSPRRYSSSSGGSSSSSSSEALTTFTKMSVRLGFVKKVFGILVVQMVITLGIMSALIFPPAAKNYLMVNSWVYITSLCLQFPLMIILGWVNISRKYPINLIILLVLTVVIGVCLGSIASSLDVDAVLIAVAIVCGVVIICFIMGCQTRFDYTLQLGIVVVCLAIVLAFGFLSIFFYGRIVDLAYASLGTLLFSLWLVVDIQLILGGKHKYKLDPEEYIYGTLSVYLDIVNVLLFVFLIMSRS